MNLRNTLLVSSALIVAGAAATHWYLNTSDRPGRPDTTFKVGFLPVT